MDHIISQLGNYHVCLTLLPLPLPNDTV